MRRLLSVKSQEELQSDIICLKRQLALALDENQLLKVKVRRLEDELRRKDKYIETFQADPRRLGRFVHEQSATSLINKLQRRIHDLEAMMLERNLQEEKRYKNLKTMSLYSHNVNCQGKTHVFTVQLNKSNLDEIPMTQASRKRTKSSLQDLAQFNFRPPSNSPSRRLLAKPNHCIKFDSQKSNNHCSKSSDDDPNIQWSLKDASEMSNALKSLEWEKVVGERLLRIKDAEISRLSAELRDIKNLLKQQERNTLIESITSAQLRKPSISFDLDVKSVHENFVEENEIHASRSQSDGDKSSRTSDKCLENEHQTQYSKLETLLEQNGEEICIPTNSQGTSVNLQDDRNSRDRNSIRPKTRIEYVYDSEVSSDGEEFNLTSNLTSFLQQSVNTSPYDEPDDVDSD